MPAGCGRVQGARGGGQRKPVPCGGEEGLPRALGSSVAGPTLCSPKPADPVEGQPTGCTRQRLGLDLGLGGSRRASQGPTQFSPSHPHPPPGRTGGPLPSQHGPPRACLCSRPFSRVKKPVSWTSAAPAAPPGAAPTYPAEWDAVLLEDDGRDEGHLVPQEGVAALGAPGEEP